MRPRFVSNHGKHSPNDSYPFDASPMSRLCDTSRGIVRTTTKRCKSGQQNGRHANSCRPEKYPRFTKEKSFTIGSLDTIRMGMMGLEPILSCENWILNPARLPIPPHPRPLSNITNKKDFKLFPSKDHDFVSSCLLYHATFQHSHSSQRAMDT